MPAATLVDRPIFTSRSNPHVARVRALRRRSERETSGLFLAEGTRLISRAIELGWTAEELVVAPDLLRDDVSRALVDRLRRVGVPVRLVSSEVFETLTARDGPQGILGVLRQRWTRLADARPGRLGWVALDSIQDPGNLGCILRSADAVGAEGVILVGDTADPYDPAAIRSSTGGVFSLRLVRSTADDFAAWKRASGTPVVGTACADAIHYRSISYPAPAVLLMGSEQHGLSRTLLDLCDAVVSIPMLGRCDSLNLAVATALVLYEMLGQRQPRPVPRARLRGARGDGILLGRSRQSTRGVIRAAG